MSAKRPSEGGGGGPAKLPNTGLIFSGVRAVNFVHGSNAMTLLGLFAQNGGVVVAATDASATHVLTDDEVKSLLPKLQKLLASAASKDLKVVRRDWVSRSITRGARQSEEAFRTPLEPPAAAAPSPQPESRPAAAARESTPPREGEEAAAPESEMRLHRNGGSRDVPGLHLLENAFSEEVEMRLFHHPALFKAENLPSETNTVSAIMARHFSDRYHIDAKRVTDNQSVTPPDYPPELLALIETARETFGLRGSLTFPEDAHCLTYLNGGRMFSHVDSVWHWGLCVIGINLGASCYLEMSPLKTSSRSVKVPIHRRSMFVLTGAARSAWKHAIVDVGQVGNQQGSSHLPRRSITLRSTRTWERMELERKIAAEPPSSVEAAELRRSLQEHVPQQVELKERDASGRYWRDAPPNAGLPAGTGWPFSEQEMAAKREGALALRRWLDGRGIRW